jgi:hypothetical protein
MNTAFINALNLLKKLVICLKMDRFLIKNPTANDSRLQKQKASGSRMKQATITSLKVK